MCGLRICTAATKGVLQAHGNAAQFRQRKLKADVSLCSWMFHCNLTLLMSYGALRWGARHLSFSAAVGLCSNPSTLSDMQCQTAGCHSYTPEPPA